MKQHFNNPKILIILGKLDGENKNSNPLNFDEYYEEKRIVNKIVKYKVEVVLVEKAVNRYIIDQLLKHDVTIV